MDLPIDHFRLLGVSPSAAADAILRKLQSRCDSPPDQGFTHEVLIQRDELLRQSADLLTDSVRRSEYEAQLLDLSQHHPGDTVGLDLPSSSEAAGLLLLVAIQTGSNSTLLLAFLLLGLMLLAMFLTHDTLQGLTLRCDRPAPMFADETANYPLQLESLSLIHISEPTRPY